MRVSRVHGCSSIRRASPLSTAHKILRNFLDLARSGTTRGQPSQGRVSEFKTVLARLAEAERFLASRARGVFIDPARGGDAGPARRFFDGAAPARRTPDELIGAAQAMRAAMSGWKRPRRHGYCGHWRRRRQYLQYINPVGDYHQAACGRDRGQAWRQGGVFPFRRLGRSGRACVKVGLDPAAAAACLREAGICSWRRRRTIPPCATRRPSARNWACGRSSICSAHVQPRRRDPAGSWRLRQGMAGAHGDGAARTRAQNVWLLHGSDGLDEATTTGKTFVVALEDARFAPSKSRPRTPACHWRRRKPQGRRPRS